MNYSFTKEVDRKRSETCQSSEAKKEIKTNIFKIEPNFFSPIFSIPYVGDLKPQPLDHIVSPLPWQPRLRLPRSKRIEMSLNRTIRKSNLQKNVYKFEKVCFHFLESFFAAKL